MRKCTSKVIGIFLEISTFWYKSEKNVLIRISIQLVRYMVSCKSIQNCCKLVGFKRSSWISWCMCISVQRWFFNLMFCLLEEMMWQQFYSATCRSLFLFLAVYGDLFLYLLQGLENVNSVLKRSFHWSSSEGGGRRGSSKLVPIMHWLICAMMWRCRYLDGLFAHSGFDDRMLIKYGEKENLPKFDNVKLEEYQRHVD